MLYATKKCIFEFSWPIERYWNFFIPDNRACNFLLNDTDCKNNEMMDDRLFAMCHRYVHNVYTCWGCGLRSRAPQLFKAGLLSRFLFLKVIWKENSVEIRVSILSPSVRSLNSAIISEREGTQNDLYSVFWIPYHQRVGR